MKYLQVRGGQKLHLVMEAGEETPAGDIIRRGYISNPLCNRPMGDIIRMTINLPLANACKNCQRVYRAWQRRQDGE